MPDFSFLEDGDGEEKPIRVNTRATRRRPANRKPAKKQHVTSEQVGGCGCLLIIALFCVVAAFAPKETQKSFDAGDNRRLAVICAQDQIKSLLKAPASAKWPGAFSGVDLADHATKNADGTYDVNSYVDAQNSFGAMIRTRYFVRLRVLNDGNFRTIEAYLIE